MIGAAWERMVDRIRGLPDPVIDQQITEGKELLAARQLNEGGGERLLALLQEWALRDGVECDEDGVPVDDER